MGAVAALGELLQPLGVLALDAKDDRQLCVGIAAVGHNVAGVGRSQIGVEIAGLGIGVFPWIVGDAHPVTSLRSRAEEA